MESDLIVLSDHRQTNEPINQPSTRAWKQCIYYSTWRSQAWRR